MYSLFLEDIFKNVLEDILKNVFSKMYSLLLEDIFKNYWLVNFTAQNDCCAGFLEVLSVLDAGTPWSHVKYLKTKHYSLILRSKFCIQQKFQNFNSLDAGTPWSHTKFLKTKHYRLILRG